MPRPAPRPIPASGRVLSWIVFLGAIALMGHWGELKGVFLRFSGGGFPESPAGIVSDFADVLSPEGERRLSAVSDDLERRTGAELRFVTVKTLAGYTKEKYANELFTRWGVGKKGKNNGVLVLVAPNDRQAWIEVGYGLEGVLPDGLCGDIFRNTMKPYFQGGDYDGGVLNASNRIVRAITGEAETASGGAAEPATPSGDDAVHDSAGMLDSKTRETVAHYIGLLRAKGVELAVVTVPRPVESGADSQAEAEFFRLGLGEKGRALILLVSPFGPKAGMHLSPDLLPANEADRFTAGIKQAVESTLKDGNAEGAFWTAAADIWKVLGGERGSVNGVTNLPVMGKIGLVLFIGVFIGIGFFMVGAGLGSRTGFPVLWGSFFGGMPLVFFSSLMFLNPAGYPFFAIHILLAVSMLVFGYRTGQKHPDSFHGKSSGGSGWAWGGGGGGGFGGGGGGGFGGGSSGGGGGGGSW